MPQQWYGRKPALGEEHWRELVEVRRLIHSIPPVDELARRWGVSRQSVRNYLRNRLPKQIRIAVEHDAGN